MYLFAIFMVNSYFQCLPLCTKLSLNATRPLRPKKLTLILDTVTQSKIGDVYWGASVASETLTGVKIKKNRGCLLASERSETLSGVTQSRCRYTIYLSVYGVRETSVFARASNYVS